MSEPTHPAVPPLPAADGRARRSPGLPESLCSPRQPRPPEVHISSLVVHSTPKRVASVEAAIAQMPDAQVHGTSPAGKIVVTLEAGGSREMLDKVSAIQLIDGVLSAALVYQFADSLESMQEMVNEEQAHGHRST